MIKFVENSIPFSFGSSAIKSLIRYLKIKLPISETIILHVDLYGYGTRSLFRGRREAGKV
jgi:hypothetical protein